nr:homolog of EHV2 ORF33 tegument protein UL16 [Macronycteris gammaherpesvirus 1]
MASRGRRANQAQKKGSENKPQVIAPPISCSKFEIHGNQLVAVCGETTSVPIDKAKECLRQFLNKECIWKRHHHASRHLKVFISTTAISNVFKPLLHKSVKLEPSHAVNVTVILVKPTGGEMCIVVYINNQIFDISTPEVIFTKQVPGSLGLSLIYFGPFRQPDKVFKVPAPVHVSSRPVRLFSNIELFSTSNHHVFDMTSPDLPGDFQPIGKGVWFSDGCFYTYFLSMEYMMCCPQMCQTPSLGRILNLLTRCKNSDCVPCYGKHIHANVAGGFTDAQNSDNGVSQTCPCVLSCAFVKSDTAKVTGNKQLLSLLFVPAYRKRVTHLKFLPLPKPHRLSRCIHGLDKNGERLTVSEDGWKVLMLSAFFSRCTLYECQILKRMIFQDGKY